VHQNRKHPVVSTMHHLLKSTELLECEWRNGIGTRAPKAAVQHRKPEVSDAPIALSQKVFEATPATFRIPESKIEQDKLLRSAARNAAERKLACINPDGEKRKSQRVDPYNARTEILKRLHDPSTGVVPEYISVDAHPLQVQLLEALFSPSGPLSDHSQTVGSTTRTSAFFLLAKEVAQNISELVADGIEGWSFDIVKVNTARSSNYNVDTKNYPAAKFGNWNPLVPVHRVVFVSNGERCTSFVSEFLREKRDNPDMTMFQFPFYSTLFERLTKLRDDQVDNRESRAKDAKTTENARTKKCGERRAYPILGPLDYHIYLLHKGSIALVAKYFDYRTYEKKDAFAGLPVDVTQTCKYIITQAGLERTDTEKFAQEIAKQHHYETKLQATCVLFSECFTCMIDSSNAFMLDDLELRNGLFVLTSVQCNAKKDTDSSNNCDIWLLKVIHHMLKIQDGRLNDTNFENVTTLPKIEQAKKHVSGSLNNKISDCICRLQANLVSIIAEKIISYYRLRFNAFAISGMLEDEWMTINLISNTAAKREAILHGLHHHKGDVQAPVTTYTSRTSRSKCGAASADTQDPSSPTALMVVDGDSDVDDDKRDDELLVGSASERINLDCDVSMIHAVIQSYKPSGESDSNGTDEGKTGAFSEEDKMVVFNDEMKEAGLHEQYARACPEIGWLSLSSRKPCSELIATCSTLLGDLTKAKEFCLRIMNVHKEISPLYDNAYRLLLAKVHDIRGKSEAVVDAKDLALVNMKSSAFVNLSYTSAVGEVVGSSTSCAYGFKPSTVKGMLGSPSNWNSLISTVNADIKNINEAVDVVLEYDTRIRGAQVSTFFDFTDRLTAYIQTLVKYKAAVIEEDADTQEPIGLSDHSPKKTNITFVKTRLGAFLQQRDEWNTNVLRSLDIALKLAGSWAGLDNPDTKILPANRLTHKNVAVSSIMYMLTICEVNGVLLVTYNAEEFEEFRNGKSETASSCVMAVLCDKYRRNISMSNYSALVAFAGRSAKNWKTVCCMVEVAFYVLVHARNKRFNVTNASILRNECTVMLHDDDRFVHIYEEHRDAAKEKIALLETRVSNCYPSSYEWQFSDDDMLTYDRIKTLCATVPSILNKEKGFINYSGVKDRCDKKCGIFKISESKHMLELEALSFNLFFYDTQFGTTPVPGKRMDVCGSSPSGSDPAHTSEMDIFGVVPDQPSEPPSQRVRRN